MSEFMQPVRQELRRLQNSLDDDLDEFNNKLDFTRENVLHYIDQQIKYLTTIKNDFNDEFNYLENENAKTCRDNQQRFDKLCLAVNQNDHDLNMTSNLLERFKQTFPMRPTMLKSIPKYDFKNIQIDDFIIKQNSFENNSSSHVINQSLNNGFHPIDEQSMPPLPTTSIGSSYHTQLASQNHDEEIEPQSRLTSTCSTISGGDNMLDLLFKLNYQHNRKPHLMCYNEEDNCLLMYSLSPHEFKYVPLKTRLISLIVVPFPEPILNLGYSKTRRLFYCSTQQTNRFLLFRLNEKEIKIEQEIELIKKEDHFISTHIYENLIYFLYLSSTSIVMFGKYDLQTSSILEPISFQNKLYDAEEKCSYDIIDFTINNSYFCFLTRLKNKNKYMIIIHDYETMDKLHSFDLIDAGKPLSIVSTERKLTSSITTMSNENIQSLLFINDVKSHLIHCCSYQEYLIPIQVNAFGICSLKDGNLSLVASRDVRGLKIQDYLQRNNVQVE